MGTRWKGTKMTEGYGFIQDVFKLSSECEKTTDEYLDLAFTQNLISTHEHLGTVFLLLDKVSSCYWKCNGGDHISERLIGRCSDYGLCSLNLARSGFYDESIALIRIIGETTNLICLFSKFPDKFSKWKEADEGQRRECFSPVKVRLFLEENNIPIPMDQSRYKQLSEKSIYSLPNIPPQMYNSEQIPHAGGKFQEAGLGFTLAELGLVFSKLSIYASELCPIKNEQKEKLYITSLNLHNSLENARKVVNFHFPNTYNL